MFRLELSNMGFRCVFIPFGVLHLRLSGGLYLIERRVLSPVLLLSLCRLQGDS